MKMGAYLRHLDLCVWLVTFILITSDLAVGDRGLTYFLRVLKDYDKEVFPAAPTKVGVQLYIKQIRIEEASSSMYVDGYISMQWQDKRLRPLMTIYSKGLLPESIYTRLYRPNVILANAVQVAIPDTLGREEYWSLRAGNVVLLSTRLRGTFSCGDWSGFSNNKTCPIILESANKDDLEHLAWLSKTVPEQNVQLEFPKRHKLSPGYTMTGKNVTSYTTAAISNLAATFHFRPERKFGASVIYAVSFVLVLVAWLGFWLDGKPMTRRGCLYLIILLLMQCGYMRTTDQRVVPAGNLHLWLGVCELLVYAALVEFIIVHVVLRIVVGKTRRLKSGTSNSQETGEQMNTDRVSNIIDIICAVVYLLAFIVFNIIFWIVI